MDVATNTVKTVELGMGDGQPAVRISWVDRGDGEADAILELGWPKPWRTINSIEMPGTILPSLATAMLDLGVHK